MLDAVESGLVQCTFVVHVHGALFGSLQLQFFFLSFSSELWHFLWLTIYSMSFSFSLTVYFYYKRKYVTLQLENTKKM